MITNRGSTTGICNTATLWSSPWQAYVPSGDGP